MQTHKVHSVTELYLFKKAKRYFHSEKSRSKLSIIFMKTRGSNSNSVLVKQYIKTVHRLEDILQFEDIYHIRSLSYEKLIRNRLGYSSVRINDQFRLIFTEIISDNEPYE